MHNYCTVLNIVVLNFLCYSQVWRLFELPMVNRLKFHNLHIKSVDDIRQLETGHVALLKGESWQGNEGKGIVHRSPHSDSNYRRLYLTIDFVESFINIFGSSMKIQF